MNKQLKSILLIFTCMVVLLGPVVRAVDASGSIRLKAQAELAHDEVLLRHIADLEGQAAEAYADVIVAKLPAQSASVTVTHQDVRSALDAAGAHWGRLSLRGFQSCIVRHVASDQPVAQQTATANPAEVLDTTSPMTLRELVVTRLASLSGVNRHELVIRFSDRDEAQLAVSSMADRFEIEPLSTEVLGRVPLSIRRLRGDQVIETVRVQADVSRRMLAVVARGGIARGQTFAPSDVEVREVMLTSARGEPATDPRAVIGQVAAAVLRADTVIYPEHVQSPLMVRRGELVTVRALAGGLSVRTVARAMDDGPLGQQIQVRNERSRQTFLVQVTGPQQVVVDTDDLKPSQEDQSRD